jgi:hypothetical protein
MLNLFAASLQYVKVPVSATVNGVAYDPTSDTVQIAFTPVARDPDSADWLTASWETDGSSYFARVLVGPGGSVQLAAGTFAVWVKVVDDPEVPVLQAGTITIT